jgi:hypothetical protein
VKLAAGGVRIEVELAGARELPPPQFDPALPGASILLRGAWQSGLARLDLACVTAPARGWLPGLQDTVLDAASAKLREAAGLAELSAGPIARRERYFEQPIEWRGDGVIARGRHVLGFIGAERDALVCSMVCTARAGTSCDEPMSSFRLAADFVNEPEPGFMARAVASVIRAPRLAAATGAGWVIVAVGLLLYFRPRPRRR